MTTAQAAAKLKITERRVVQLLKTGDLQGEKPGRDWIVSEESVANYSPRPSGAAGHKKKLPNL